MEWIVLMSLIAGVFLNLCFLAYILGILYVFPMAFGPGDYDPPTLFLALIGTILTTVLGIVFYQRGRFIGSVCILYGWWFFLIWMLQRLFLRWWT